MMDKFGHVVGFSYLKALHLNDSKGNTQQITYLYLYELALNIYFSVYLFSHHIFLCFLLKFYKIVRGVIKAVIMVITTKTETPFVYQDKINPGH